AGILAVVEVIRLFDLVYGSTQGGPGTPTLTNAVAIFRIGVENFDTGYAAATSLVILVITILVGQGFVRVLREGESTGEQECSACGGRCGRAGPGCRRSAWAWPRGLGS